jgi:hypothetical protein
MNHVSFGKMFVTTVFKKGLSKEDILDSANGQRKQ